MKIDGFDLGIDYCDAGPWRNYELSTEGGDVDECLRNASISEIDQDGGELATYGYGDASNQVAEAVRRVVTVAFQLKTGGRE